MCRRSSSDLVCVPDVGEGDGGCSEQLRTKERLGFVKLYYQRAQDVLFSDDTAEGRGREGGREGGKGGRGGRGGWGREGRWRGKMRERGERESEGHITHPITRQQAMLAGT